MRSELLQRVLTALILAPLAVWAILALGSDSFGMLLLSIIALAAWEWAGLAGIDANPGRLAYAATLVVLGVGCSIALQRDIDLTPLLWLVVPLWLWALRVVVRFPAPLPATGAVWFVALLGVPMLLLPWLALVLLHRLPLQGPTWVLLLMAVIWGADIGAYFSGRRFGKRKLLI